MKHHSGNRQRKSRWEKFGDAFVTGIGFVGGVSFTIFFIVLVLGSFHR